MESRRAILGKWKQGQNNHNMGHRDMEADKNLRKPHKFNPHNKLESRRAILGKWELGQNNHNMGQKNMEADKNITGT